MSASAARRQTWTIIGWPPISASGLRGSRTEASRDGMMTIGFATGRREGTVSGALAGAEVT